MFVVGKKTAIKVMKQKKLSLLGDMNSNIEDVVSEATKFIGDCYGMPLEKQCQIRGKPNHNLIFALFSSLSIYSGTGCGSRELGENSQMHLNYQLCLQHQKHYITSVQYGNLVF